MKSDMEDKETIGLNDKSLDWNAVDLDIEYEKPNKLIYEFSG